MSATPLVSICMPAYRHEQHVGAAIESLLAQSVGDFELLIAEDRSPDRTYEVICSYKDPRISVVQMPQRSGPSITLNSAMRRARGRYIGLCSSDDRWLPDKLERQLAYMEAHPQAGAVFSRPWLIDADGARLPDDVHPLGMDFGGETFCRSQWLARMFFEGNCLCAITPLMRASAVRDVGEFNPLMLQLQDFDYWVRLVARHELHFQSDRQTEYRVNLQGASLSTSMGETYARTAYEYYQVLKHFANGLPADAVAALPLRGESFFPWQAKTPSRALRLAEHALHTSVTVPQQSFAHFMFALDCMNTHGRDDSGLKGADGEERMLPLAFFEVSGSSMAQDFFISEERTLQLRQLQAAQAAGLVPATASPAEKPPGSLWDRLRQAMKGDSRY